MSGTRDWAVWYLRSLPDHEERLRNFFDLTHSGQRDGQAFMNCLPREDYKRIAGTLHDPFYKDGNLPAAIDLLTTKGRM